MILLIEITAKNNNNWKNTFFFEIKKLIDHGCSYVYSKFKYKCDIRK